MGYIESNLLPDERVVYKATLHWIIFLKPFVVILIGIALLGVEPAIGGIVIVVGSVVGLPAFIDYKTSEFGVTSKRVIVKVGLLRRRTLELLLRQVEAISVDQSLLGRLLGFGSLTLTGTGGVREVFHNIASPLEFRRRIQGQAT
ncbi:MAG: putative permease of the major facilitator superfamily [Acidobacteria bacterium]|nr:putative permease of the major facilitator superfamily [Acidobacteriota bacterium]